MKSNVIKFFAPLRRPKLVLAVIAISLAVAGVIAWLDVWVVGK